MFYTFSGFLCRTALISLAELIKSFHFYFLSNDRGCFMMYEMTISILAVDAAAVILSRYRYGFF